MLRGVSLKQPGFANSLVLRIGLLILLSLAVFTFSLYLLIGRPTIDRLTESQMRLAAEQLDARVTRLFKTVEVTLRSSQGWAISSDIEQSQLRRFNEFFFPIIANHGEISSVIFAHESGREILLLLTSDGHWINRISNPEEWGSQSYWITWDKRRQIEKVEMRESSYDARQRPWFKGAMALPSADDVFWTEPYIFFTTKEPGLTASMRWQGADGSSYVIAHDVRLIDLAEFTTRMTVGSQGKAALFLKEGKLIAPPRDPRFSSREAINQALLKTAEELDLPEFAEAYRLWQANPKPDRGLHTFAGADGSVVSLFRRLDNNTSGIWLGVIAPEGDFVPISRDDLLLLGLILLSAIALGMAVALHIARRFGEPLNALAEDSTRIGQLALDQPVATDAPWREVIALASALEGMRKHLQSARQAHQDANIDLELKVAKRTVALRQSQTILQKREAFFRAVFDNAAVGIISLNPEGQAVLVNPAFARFIGQPIDALLTHPDKIVLPAAVQERMNEVLPRMAAGQTESVRSEFEFTGAEGESCWGDVQIAPVRDSDGKLDSLLITVLDVTDRRQIQTELIRQFTFLQALLDTIPNPIFYKGEHTRFLGCNRAYETFFGVERSQFIGKKVLDLEYLPEEARLAYQAEDEKVIADCSRVSREVQLPDAEGQLHDTLYSVTCFRAPDGTAGGLIGVIVDISALKEAKREAERARAIAESAAAAKADFLANMSHEIRTPMNAIIGMTHLALQTELTPRQKNYLSKVDNAAKGLLGIINDILDLSKIEAGMMHFEHAPFSLDGCLRQLGDMCSLKARERGLELLYDVAPDVPDRLIGDSLRLSQVLLNLVGNAIKFTETGEITVQVARLATTDQGLELGFEVRDTGIGMTPDQQEHLFSAFTQADTSTTRKYGGTGLGLSICKRIVDLQGGSISVTSQLGAGSCFAFRLPFGLAAGDEVVPRRIGLPNDLRALVVDDSPGACEIFTQMLTTLGIDCHAVSGAAAAFDELAAANGAGQPYGLLIIDWKMPGMDGVELVSRINQSPHAGQAAIVMATAFDHEELQAALGQLSIGAILSKPATPSSLFDSIMVALHRESGSLVASAVTPGKIARQFFGKRVLLVEDNEVNRELAQEMLSNMGLSVDLAENGLQAVERVQHVPYDLVLMDCHMPVMDGYEATVRIRHDLQMRQLPIIAMTANALPADRERCLAVGMDDHIPKPIDVGVLNNTLALWLGSADGTPQLPTPVGSTLAASSADLDIRAALDRMGGDQAMYNRLLGRFRENQGDAIERLRHAQSQGDAATMLLRAHTLRGLAGNIGALALSRLAGELEQRLRDGMQVADPAIDQLVNQLDNAMAMALAIPDRPVTPAKPQAPQIHEPEAPEEALSYLQQLLDNDDAVAVSYFNELAAWLRQTAESTLVEQLARQISQYDFEEATATLQKIVIARRNT